MSTPGSTPVRDRILEVASRLFYRHGFVSVGVDTIIAEARVAKMSLYRHFPSKDALIVAYLEQSNERFWTWFDESLGAGPPRDQLTRLFRSLAEFATNPHCLGCMFQLAAADFPDPDHAAHQLAQQHKRAVLARLEHLARQAAASDAHAVAAQLFLLMDGAFAATRMFGRESPAAQVGAAAEAVLACRLPAA